MILVGIDDTDTATSPGTNQVARAIVAELSSSYRCKRIVRHQLLFDPRVPYTSKNSCCSLLMESRLSNPEAVHELRELLGSALLNRFQPGSDPGLCLAVDVPEEVVAFGQKCQRDVVDQQEARDLAPRSGIDLSGLGGTEDGVIGALAAVGLAATENDGRVVQIQGQPDDLSGPRPFAEVRSRGVDQVCSLLSKDIVTDGTIDVGKHLRPNLRQGQIVLFVEPCASAQAKWTAVRLT